MKRCFQQWLNCDPHAMAHAQSDVAKQFAFEDAKADILELHAENLRLRNVMRMIAYPQRGTFEEGCGVLDFAKLIQSAYTAEQLWVDPADR